MIPPLIEALLPNPPEDLLQKHTELCNSPHDMSLRWRFTETLRPHHQDWSQYIESALQILEHHHGERDLTDIELLQLHRSKSHFLPRLLAASQSSNPWPDDISFAAGAGFLEMASVKALFWLEHGATVRAHYPVRFLSLAHVKDLGHDLSDLDGITELLGMNLSDNQLNSDELRHLLTTLPPMKHLVWLNLSHNHLDQEAIPHLLSTDKLPHLQVLNINNNPLENPIPELWIDQGYPIGHGESSAADALCQIYGYKPWLYPSLNPESSYLHP